MQLKRKIPVGETGKTFVCIQGKWLIMNAKRSLDKDIEQIVHRRYREILFADFTADRYFEIFVKENGMLTLTSEESEKKLSERFAEFADGSLCAREDIGRIKEFTSIKNIKNKLSVNPKKSMCISYERRDDEESDKYYTVNLEIFPDTDENGHNVGYIFLKDMTSEIKSYVRSIEDKERLKAEKQTGSVRTVLIVEDNKINIAIAEKILSEKFNVLLAENGQEAVDVLENNENVSLILLDLHMPVMDGYRFMREKKQIPSIADIPVIVTTSDARAEDEIKCLSLGATDVISKPYNRDVMLSRVESVIRLHESSVALSAVERDDVTGLYTRSAFFHYAERITAQNKDTDYDISIADIDKFRLVNQKYGTEIGDAVLRIVADVLKKYLKNPKILLGRYGADQFAIFGPSDLRSEYAAKDNVSSEIERKLKKSEVDETVKIVIKKGVYSRVDRNIPISEMCDRAIMALKTVKPEYGDKEAVFNDAMMEELKNTHMIEQSMQEALRKKQIKVYFQPKHDAKTGNLVGAEALVRWIHPERGFMNPGMFIPIFEKNGFISKMDQYVIKTVCKNIKEWEKQKINLVPVSVNISRRDLLIKEDEGLLTKFTEDAGVDKNLIHLEITESVYGGGDDWLIERMRKLRDQGFKIEMDDFGSGYSTLSTIKSMPMDIVKLDMNFVRHLEEQTEVVKAVTDMCHVLGKKVTAEGVETNEQLEILRELGCDTIQGYCYSKPLPYEEFTEYLKKF